MRAARMSPSMSRRSRSRPGLRVSTKSVYQWRRRWLAGEMTALASNGPGGTLCRLSPEQLLRLRADSDHLGPAAHGWTEDQRWTLARIATLIGRLFHVSCTLRRVSYPLRGRSRTDPAPTPGPDVGPQRPHRSRDTNTSALMPVHHQPSMAGCGPATRVRPGPQPRREPVVNPESRPGQPRHRRRGPPRRHHPNRIKRIQYRPDLIPGFLTQTGLTLEPEPPRPPQTPAIQPLYRSARTAVLSSTTAPIRSPSI